MNGYFDPSFQAQMDDYYQSLIAMHQRYQEALRDAASSSASYVWQRPVEESVQPRISFRVHLPFSLITIPVCAGMALFKVLHSRRSKLRSNDVIDLYSVDGEVWKPGNWYFGSQNCRDD